MVFALAQDTQCFPDGNGRTQFVKLLSKDRLDWNLHQAFLNPAHHQDFNLAHWYLGMFRSLAVFVLVQISSTCFAQQTITTPDGQTITIPAGAPPEVIQQMMQNRMGGRARPAPSAKKPEAKKEEKKDESKDKKDGDAKEEKKGPPENITRSSEPPSEPDPKEFETAIPSDDGLVRFQFRNQPWPKLLQWYAKNANLSFDWQELPGDYINLSTRRRGYSMEETGDMINRALLMRGFTMLEEGETLTVIKTEGINPALVPRVNPTELSGLPPHKFVRTTFALTWLLAEEVNQEFASMISKNGTLTPLQSTNRIEAMDAAVNLLEIQNILEQEQSAIALENLAREFPLVHARAAAVKVQLETFLGIQSSGGGGSISSGAARMIQQQMQQMQQQLQQAARNNQGNKGGASRKRPDNVYLVANERSNSLIVHAPPNKMALIESFIRRVDVRNETSADFQRLNTRMKVFRLASLSPGELVESLNAMDVLEPSTRLQVDENNNAIIAYASVADQYMIQNVIDRLDGSQRRFEVISLRRLDAESVAGSIKFLMGADEEDGKSSRNYDPYGYYGFYGSSRSRSSNTSKDKMRVGANVQDNQLLLWVNDIELDEVNNLLVKLGEIPERGASPSNVRVIDASRQPETYEYLRKLKEQWDMVSPNPLEIPDVSEFATQDLDEPNPKQDPASETDSTTETDTENSDANSGEETNAGGSEEPEDGPKEPNPAPADENKITHSSNPGIKTVKFTQVGSPQTSAQQAPAEVTENTDPNGSETQNKAKAAPVRIFLDEGGNLVLNSNDTDALDRLEQIMQANKPPKKPYDIFKVKYARASWVSLNLKEYFDKEENNRPRFFSFFGEQDEDEDRQLGDKPPLKFISDNDTKSIVVQGADDIDRQTIRDLIKLWDVPEEVDDSNFRYTELIPIKYSRAENIVKVIKEAYRDLLSANDKTFQEGDGDDENKRSGGGGGSGGDGGFSFTGLKGKLSLGADTITNSILISTEGKELLDVVKNIIEELDSAAKTEGAVEVYKVSGSLNGRSLEKTLAAIFGKPKKDQNQNQQQQQNQEAEQAAAQQAAQQQALEQANESRGRRGRGRDR